MKLGKLAPKQDRRTLAIRSVLLKQVTPPTTYSFDDEHPGLPLPMFANDQYGDCVIAARAHQTIRFELQEQGRVIRITDDDVLKAYFRETGGDDTGLVMLDSLNVWRNTGFRVGNRTYKIKAYGAVSPRRKSDVKQVIYADIGVYTGLALPLSAQAELNAGKPWSKTSGAGSTPGSWGGHCVYVCGYNVNGPIGITWGKRQAMTWAWFAKYCDEAYAVLDAINTAKKSLVIDQDALDSYLASL